MISQRKQNIPVLEENNGVNIVDVEVDLFRPFEVTVLLSGDGDEERHQRCPTNIERPLFIRQKR